ncbi:hypothetical protein C8J57DRAFT_178810 [Mycena rebaudengoi]|nr:hypothetical protein C8J57DRAFT_178810 [Mycena rebaudengoi]
MRPRTHRTYAPRPICTPKLMRPSYITLPLSLPSRSFAIFWTIIHRYQLLASSSTALVLFGNDLFGHSEYAIERSRHPVAAPCPAWRSSTRSRRSPTARRHYSNFRRVMNPQSVILTRLRMRTRKKQLWILATVCSETVFVPKKNNLRIRRLNLYTCIAVGS